MQEFRSEYKFICTQGQMEIIRSRMRAVLKSDAHQAGACYRIRSLYFDDADDSAFFDNDAGVDARRKFRLRIYENTQNGARLEIKYKLHGGTKKDSCMLSADACSAIIRGEIPALREGDPPELQLLSRQMHLHALTPRIIVEYERSAFVSPLGNVRVTLDRNISFSNQIDRFMEDSIPLIPVLPKGVHLVEMKYDELIPDYVLQLLETGDLSRTTFSKYYLARLAQKGEYVW
jgi:hypothetical protein